MSEACEILTLLDKHKKESKQETKYKYNSNMKEQAGLPISDGGNTEVCDTSRELLMCGRFDPRWKQ